MARPRLYVRSSVQVSGATSQGYTTSTAAPMTGGFDAGGGFRLAESKIYTLTQNDLLAKQLLTRAGIRFDLVDLSKGTRISLGARLRGVTETPALWENDGPVKLHKGIGAISKYVEGKTARPKNSSQDQP